MRYLYVIHKNMKKFISLFIILFALVNYSCSNKTNNSENKNTKLEEAKSKYLSEHHSFKKDSNKEIIILLSIKYELPIDLAQKITSEFLMEESSLRKALSVHRARTEEEFEQLKSKLETSPINERIRKFSIENNVSESKIASLLIDYKILYERRETKNE